MGIAAVGAQTIDAILALLAIEGLALFSYRFVTGRGPSPMPMLFTLLAGGFLLLALRGSLIGAPPTSVAAFAGAAFIAHCADLASRWASAPQARQPRMRATIALRVPDDRRSETRGAADG